MVGRISCISWMHTVLHTHSVLSPGPAVLQMLANWETFCAVKIRTGEARLWLIRCDTSQKSQSNEKLRHVLHTHCNKGSSARWRLTARVYFMPLHPVLSGPVTGLPRLTHRALWEPLRAFAAAVLWGTFNIDTENFSVKFLRFILVVGVMKSLFLSPVLFWGRQPTILQWDTVALSSSLLSFSLPKGF